MVLEFVLFVKFCGLGGEILRVNVLDWDIKLGLEESNDGVWVIIFIVGEELIVWIIGFIIEKVEDEVEDGGVFEGLEGVGNRIFIIDFGKKKKILNYYCLY